MCYRIYRFRELERFCAFFVDKFLFQNIIKPHERHMVWKKMNETKTNTEHKKQVILSI